MTSLQPIHAGDTRIRPAGSDDMRAAFAVFRRSIMAYVHRHGIVESPLVSEAMLDEAWHLRGQWVEHLWRTAAENWLAIDADGRPVGWALSVEREGHLELSFFFVDPETQSKGLGRALLEHAFPLGRGRHRAIVATQDPRALSLYLRFGVRFVTTIVDFEHPPRPATVDTDLEFARLAPDDAAVDLIAGIEQQLIGHRREVDTRFLLTQRPAWVARRGGVVAGFAFGAQDELTGPMGTLDPADMPAVLALVETEAALAGETNIYFSAPLDNHDAVRHLLGRGFTLDPFVVALLADDRAMRLDRWIHTGLSYIL